MVNNNGPNQIIPCTNLTTTDADGHVSIRSFYDDSTFLPISVPALLTDTANEYGEFPAYAYKSNGKWIKRTYKEYLKEVRTCAKAFLHLGLERYKSVCIIGFNSPEWIISDLAAIFAGGFACGMYTSNSSEACYHSASKSSANIIVVEDAAQLKKIQAIKHRLPHLKAIIQYEGEPDDPTVLSWAALMEMGRKQNDDILDNVLKTVAVNECCTLVFTSGTVGQPKAVMLSHDNMIFNAVMTTKFLSIKRGTIKNIISYLPLSHVAAQLNDIMAAIYVTATVYFADRDALKGTIIYTLREVQPEFFAAVPRIWEKIYEKLKEEPVKSGSLRKAISSWTRNHALQYHLNKINGIESKSWRYITSTVILNKIKHLLGFGRCQIHSSGAAPLAPEIKKYFLSLDIVILEGFGMSECGGAHTLNTNDCNKLSTVGKTILGMKTKLYNTVHDEGELCLNGRHIFMGYLNDKEKTKETIDEEGWLHTGDLGKIDNDGFVSITGRLKEILITAGGENVAPVAIENLLKLEFPHISNAVLIGDKKKFLSVLITLKTEVDEDGLPTTILLKSVQNWLKKINFAASTIQEILSLEPNHVVFEEIRKAIDRVNTKAISNAQKIQKFAILPRDFSIETGEIGPTMKIKRSFLVNKYKNVIDELYK